MKYLQIAFQYFAYVLAGVKAVEDVMASAPGADKKAVVLSAITAATQVGEQVPESHVQTISHLIDSVVGALNASGVFKKSTPVPPKTP